MVKGATQNETGHGLEIERQYLSQYLSQHYVNAGSLDLTSIDYSIGGSVTLEYAIDDFAIARLARSLHDTSTATRDGAARRELGVRVRPGHRLRAGPGTGRQLPARGRLRDVPTRARRPDRVRGGQREPVHLVGAPGPLGPGLAHGRRRRGDQGAHDLSSPRSTPPGTSPTTGRATSPASGRPGSSTPSARPRTRSRPCAPSSTTSTPTRRSTSPATTTSVRSRRGTCGPPWASSPSLPARRRSPWPARSSPRCASSCPMVTASSRTPRGRRPPGPTSGP